MKKMYRLCLLNLLILFGSQSKIPSELSSYPKESATEIIRITSLLEEKFDEDLHFDEAVESPEKNMYQLLYKNKSESVTFSLGIQSDQCTFLEMWSNDTEESQETYEKQYETPFKELDFSDIFHGKYEQMPIQEADHQNGYIGYHLT